ncbi:hypothetical protein T11_12061 [Trichinella zimbabwensis]|uniref:Uncharacterized protein n=1 Tax=Trichinella zimbabwensis TaxID=268475 RepID=A0A0V1GY32_9BILA|nr:hypothetical protein T11_12061 [Trichinella zimbabwensis]
MDNRRKTTVTDNEVVTLFELLQLLIGQGPNCPLLCGRFHCNNELFLSFRMKITNAETSIDLHNVDADAPSLLTIDDVATIVR